MTAATVAHRTDRALARAHEMARAGHRPMLVRTTFTGSAIRELWSIASKQANGPLYTCHLTHDTAGVRVACDCEAAQFGRPCWHAEAAKLAHADAIPVDVAVLYRFRPKRS